MRAMDGRAAVKAGAEGVYAAMIPERGLGIAIKIDDGAGRAAETTIAAILDKLGLLSERSRAHHARADAQHARRNRRRAPPVPRALTDAKIS